MKKMSNLSFSTCLKSTRLYTLLLGLLAGVSLMTSCEGEEDFDPISVEHEVEVNGYLLNVRESGSGKSTVVFVSGLGEPLNTWKEVQPAVSRFATTFSYDRAGTGKSNSVPGPRTSTNVAQELHQLLINSKVKAPYVLVAHSLAGLHTRMYAKLYPQEVAGVVLLDPTMEDEIQILKSAEFPEGLTLELVLEQIAVEQNMSVSTKAELFDQFISAEQVSVVPFPQVPLSLITPMQPEEDEAPGMRELKLMLHRQFVSKVQGATHTLAQQSRHHVQKDQPEVVIESIRQITQKIK